MKSLYKRELAMMVGIVTLSFTLLSTAFMLLSYRYIISETRDRLERNAGYIASATGNYLQNFNSWNIFDNRADTWILYQTTMETVSSVSDASVIVASTQGEILYASDEGMYSKQIPQQIVDQILEGGNYAGLTNLNGIYGSNRYIAGLPVQVQLDNPNLLVNVGVVLVSGDTSGLSEMWRSTATIFFFAAVVVLLIAVIASSITSAHQTRPLTEMAEAARKFGRGEFDVRVNNYKDRCDEIGELAEAFNSMANSLAKVESQRAEFIANVSHELKTPMTTIAGFADGILDGTIPPEKERESLQVISSETRRLSRLVRRMLELSRLQSSERVAAQEQFDVAEVLLRVLVSLESKITEKDLDVQTQLPDGPVMVWGDPDAVTQVCYNLLDNAVKFSSPQGRLTLRITTKAGKAYIAIGNQGETIPPQQLTHIFDRFHKADSSRSTHKDGVGLGLYIVKTILNTYKEDITVTSQDGFTEFTFTLSEV